jgi:integrase
MPRHGPPVLSPPSGLRQRARADGTWRVWWEPTARQRRAGAVAVELRADNAGWSTAEAKRLTKRAGARAAGDPSAAPRHGGRSVSALIADYRASRWFAQLADSTRRAYGADLKAIEDKWGPEPVALFDAPTMDAWYETLLAAKGTFRARAIVQMLATLFLHAERRGWRPKGSNPCRDLRMVQPAGRARIGTWAELDACLAAAEATGAASVRLALLVAIFSGQRLTDILLAEPAHFSLTHLPLPGKSRPQPVWVWQLTRSKRGNDGALPIHPEVEPVLRAALMRAGATPGPLLRDEATGQPYSMRLFEKRWAAVRALAAKTVPSVATLQWRDLRRTFANLARRGGASDDDVADAIGNTAAQNSTLREVYMAAQLATTFRAVTAVQRPKGTKA